MGEKKVNEYTEVDRLKDQLTVANFNAVQFQLRAASNEADLCLNAKNQQEPEARAADARIKLNEAK